MASYSSAFGSPRDKQQSTFSTIVGWEGAMQTAVLGSWKEIAVYLDHGVRTTQRWERQKNLPVHRVGVGDKAPVFAFCAEIEDWLRAQPLRVPSAPTPTPRHARVCLDRVALNRQRELRAAMSNLVAVQTHKRTELRRTLKETEARMRPLYQRAA